MGDMHRNNGKLNAAVNDYQQAAPLYETLKNYSGVASVYKVIAEIQRTSQQSEAAQEIATKALVAEGIAGNQQIVLSPLKVDARVELGQDGHAFVGWVPFPFCLMPLSHL